MKLRIKFKKAYKDLDDQPEMYKEKTFQQVRSSVFEKLMRDYGRSKKSHNRVIIREMEVPVKAGTTIGDLKSVASQFRSSTGLDCFQITIDRSTMNGHFLFSTFDEKTGGSIRVNTSELKYLSAYVVIALGLEHGKSDRTAMRYFLVNEYNADRDAFDKAMQEAARVIKDDGIRNVIIDSIQYAKMVSIGICK